jgi:molybdopterin-guanine dinucleotide biosynthesis protein A
MRSMAAIILTGSRDQHNILLAGSTLHSKTLLPVYHQPMLQWVYQALAGTSFQPEIFVSTEDPDIESYDFNGKASFIKSGNSAVSSFLSAIDQIPDHYEWVLFASGDHVLLTPRMIETFVEHAIAQHLTLAVAVVKKSTVQQHYPGSIRTYMPLKGDAYSGGNLYLIHKPTFLAQRHVLEAIDTNRKKPWKSIFMLDWWTILRVFLKQVDMRELGEKASKVIGCRTACIALPYAEACMDVDKPSDKVLAEAILHARATGIPAKAIKPSEARPLTGTSSP